jgi:hypothetical protein
VELESFGLSAAQPAATSKTHRLDQACGSTVFSLI